MAGKYVKRYARSALGGAAGVAMGLGVASAMGSVLLFMTAMPPLASSHESSRMFQGFDEATQHRYSPGAADGDLAMRNAAVAAAGAAAIGNARVAARRA